MSAVVATLIKWLVLAGLCLAIALAVLNHERLGIYRNYLRGKSPEVAMRYEQLSGKMDEAAVRKHFEGVPLNCYPQQVGPGGTERICETALGKADGASALTLIAFFSKGRLTSTVVQVPWWSHRTWLDRLVAQHGKANRAGLASSSPMGGPVLRWTLPNGTLEYNRDRSFNPLEWSAVFWSAGGASN